MKLRVKIWVTANNQPIIGEGGARLMQLVKKYGSISRAAEEMAMSYRTAWGRLKEIEKRLGKPVVISKAGGGEGGRSRLTSNGIWLLEQYLELDKRINKSAQNIFEELFK